MIARRPQPVPGRSRGFTLIEVVVALLLLAIGALALAAGITAGERARREALSAGLALAAAEGWLEAWRAAPWPAPGEGEEEIAWGAWRGRVRWRTVRREACLVEARVEAAPAGRSSAVVLVTRRFREGADDCAE